MTCFMVKGTPYCWRTERTMSAISSRVIGLIVSVIFSGRVRFEFSGSARIVVLPHDREHAVKIYRFRNHVNSAKSLRMTLIVAERTQNHDRHTGKLPVWKALLLLAEAPTVHDRHRQIQEDQGG